MIGRGRQCGAYKTMRVPSMGSAFLQSPPGRRSSAVLEADEAVKADKAHPTRSMDVSGRAPSSFNRHLSPFEATVGSMELLSEIMFDTEVYAYLARTNTADISVLFCRPRDRVVSATLAP